MYDIVNNSNFMFKGKQKKEKLIILLKLFWGLIPVILLYLIWVIPINVIENRAPKLDIKVKIELEDKVRATLAQIFGGIFLLSGAYYSWKTLNQNKESQITDRFYKAVEQLGNTDSKHQTVKIGGIYALERIAIDSPKDHWTIMEVLCSIIRMDSPVLGTYEKVFMRARDDAMVKGGPLNSKSPDAVIQTIITVLGRRNTSQESNSERLDLRNTYLRGCNFSEGNFANTIFDGCHLEWAKFHQANLANASFNDAHLEAAFLCGVNMVNVSLIDSYLEGADLINANLSNSNLVMSHLQWATVDNCNIKNANLASANVTLVDINGFVNATKDQIGEAVVNLDPDDKSLTYIKEMEDTDREAYFGSNFK